MSIDTCLSQPLSTLPLPRGERESPHHISLAFRTLLRGWRMALPSGQAVARRLGIDALTARDDREDPLWIYILREAWEKRKGEYLGPVGARLVSEVFVQLMRSDPSCFLNIDPNWEPALLHRKKAFRLWDLLEKSGAPMTKHNWQNRNRP